MFEIFTVIDDEIYSDRQKSGHNVAISFNSVFIDRISSA